MFFSLTRGAGGQVKGISRFWIYTPLLPSEAQDRPQQSLYRAAIFSGSRPDLTGYTLTLLKLFRVPYLDTP